MDVQWSIEQAAEIIARQAWDASQTTEEALRDFLTEYLGKSWRNCALQNNALCGHVVYTATMMVRVANMHFPLTYVIDRDGAGQFYLASPSPVAGYE